MNEREQKINALLFDDRFVDWVTKPDSPYNAYWQQWMSLEAENASLAEEARLFLLELKKSQQQIQQEDAWKPAAIDNMWAAIDDGTTAAKEPVTKTIGGEGRKPSINKKPLRVWMMAAAAGLVLLTATWLLQQTGKPAHTKQEASVAVTRLDAEVVRHNRSNATQTCYLPDGSSVILAKGARISYKGLLDGAKREVLLTGEAFFEVERDTTRPFYIHTNNIVVKVLGTSFCVKADSLEEKVTVKTGKVSVFMKKQDLEQTAPTILLPKQACVYSVPDRTLTMSMPGKLSNTETAAIQPVEYLFEDAPVTEVFNEIEKLYAIPIQYDSLALKNCFITTRLGNENLIHKLEVLTRSVNASFTMNGNSISIAGGGCQ